MIVAKFGGAVLNGSEGLRHVLDEIRTLPKPLLVVTSAFANVTNMLERLAHTAVEDTDAARRELDALLEYHAVIARELLSSAAYEGWLDVVRPYVSRLEEVVRGLGIVRELSPRTLDLVVHFGERFSSSLLLAAFSGGDDRADGNLADRNHADGNHTPGNHASGVSALDLIITDTAHRYARPDLELTRERVQERLKPALAAHNVVVTEGYIARSISGEATTMGRESSDYTATLLAEMLGADAVRIYRALPGILTADPRAVPDARTLERLSYRMANTLAELGSQVLHPRTVVPVERSSIPLVITAIGGPATTIVTCGQEGGCSITLLPEGELIAIETGTAGAALDPFLRGLAAKAPIIWHHRSRRRLQVLLSGSYPGTLPLNLIAEPVQAERSPVGVVSLVREEPLAGSDLERFFAAIGGSQRAMQGGLDGHSVSIALDRAAAGDAVRELHRRFVEQAEGAGRWQPQTA